MICGNCGHKEEAGSKFCHNCGSRIGAPGLGQEVFQIEDDPGFASRESEYIKPMLLREAGRAAGPEDQEMGQHGSHGIRRGNIWLGRKRLFGWSAVLAAAILIIIILYRKEEQPVFYEISDHAIQIFSTEQETYVLNREGVVLHSINQPCYPYYSSDKSAAILIRTEFSFRTGAELENNLYYVNENELVELGNGSFTFDLSANGKFAVYSRLMEGNKSGLYLYDVDKQEETLLDYSADRMYAMVRMSPDGQIITYAAINTSVNPNTRTAIHEAFIIRKGKEPESLGNELIVLAVSNREDYLYYVKYHDITATSLCVLSHGREKVLSEKLDENLFAVALNGDYSEILYSDQGKTYIYTDEGKELPVADTAVQDVILPESNSEFESLLLQGIRVYQFDSFRNKVIRCNDGTLRVIGNGYAADEIGKADSVREIFLSKDGNRLIYRASGGKIMKVEDLKGNFKADTLVSQADICVAAGDLSEVYYLLGDKLYYKYDQSDPKPVAERIYNIYGNTDHTGVFFMNNYSGAKGTLYYSTNGNEPVTVIEEAMIRQITETQIGIVVRSNRNEYYYNPEGMIMNRISPEEKDGN